MGGDAEIHTQIAHPGPAPRPEQGPRSLRVGVSRLQGVRSMRFGCEPWAAGGAALWLAHCLSQVGVKKNPLLCVGAAPEERLSAGWSVRKQVNLGHEMAWPRGCHCSPCFSIFPTCGLLVNHRLSPSAPLAGEAHTFHWGRAGWPSRCFPGVSR